MLIFLISALTVSVGIGCGLFVSKKNFDAKIGDIITEDKPATKSDDLNNELSRIKKLQNNLRQVRYNLDRCDIPTPESSSSYDDAQSSLNKLSAFFERHNLTTVGSEQFILSILPSSQVGESIHALSEVVPQNVGHAIFGDALTSIKDSLHPASCGEFLHHFVNGMGQLGPYQITTMAHALEHHNFMQACATPLKSGAIEAFGINDASHHIVTSLHDIGGELASAVESSASIESLTDVTDIDISGHVPVVTIAISAFREYQLLSNDKTDTFTALKNIALDAAGAGVGAAAGAKGGAIVGSFFGPLGSVLGGIVGAVGGAIGGRFVTNKVKFIPLNNAIDAYNSSYSSMKYETDTKSRETLSNIQTYAQNKKNEFSSSAVVNDMPVLDSEPIVGGIALILYKAVISEVSNMKSTVAKLKGSIWYSKDKFSEAISRYEAQIADIESQLPNVKSIEYTPQVVVEALMNIDLPNRRNQSEFQSRISECTAELKQVNDKNDSSVLVWSYMLNNLYQKTLNDIADYSNAQMSNLNSLFSKWRNKLKELEKDINTEKGKLGIK